MALTVRRSTSVEDACRRLVRRLGEAGLLEALLRAGGGQAFDVRGLALSRDILARHDALADFAFAMQGLGPARFRSSVRVRKEGISPRLPRAGNTIAAFALSEPRRAATSAPSPRAHGATAGTGSWTAPRPGSPTAASRITTWCAPRKAEGGRQGLSAFIVDADILQVTQKIETIAPHPLATLALQSGSAALIGAPGQGFKIAMATLDVFRTTVGAAALGLARRALDEALARVKTRRVVRKSARRVPAHAGAARRRARGGCGGAARLSPAWARDQGNGRITREAAMAKLFATESAQQVIDSACSSSAAWAWSPARRSKALPRDPRAPDLRGHERDSEAGDRRGRIAGLGMKVDAFTQSSPRRSGTG